MDEHAVLELFDREMRRDVPPDGTATVERVGGLVRQTGGPNDWNGVLYSHLDASTADAVIAETVEHYRSRGLEFEWKWYSHDTPADLGDRLRAAGFVPEDDEALMIAAIAELPLESPPPPGVTLEPVSDIEGIDRVIAVHEKVFDTSGEKLRHRLREQLAVAPDTVLAVLAVAGSEDVSAARMELHAGTSFASMWGGGTLPEWRGRGIYRALVAYRAKIAHDRGYVYLQSDCTPYSRPILARLGFAHLATTVPYVYTP